MYLQITIDGPSGVGKSTLSKALAKSLGYLFLNTGLIFRGLAWYFRENKIEEQGIPNALVAMVENNDFCFDKNVWFWNGRQIPEDELIQPEISLAASRISKYPLVREYVLKIEWEVAQKNNIVIEGRDIGTAVFPNAFLKIYLTASEEVRGKRRYEELKRRGILGGKTPEDILREISLRDQEDRNRKIAPLTKPKDAVVLHSDEKGVDELVEEIKRLINEKLPRPQTLRED